LGFKSFFWKNTT